MEFAKGLQKMASSCKQTISQEVGPRVLRHQAGDTAGPFWPPVTSLPPAWERTAPGQGCSQSPQPGQAAGSSSPTAALQDASPSGRAGAQGGGFSRSPGQHAFPVHLPAGPGAGYGARDVSSAGSQHPAEPNLPPGERTKGVSEGSFLGGEEAGGLLSPSATGNQLLLGSATAGSFEGLDTGSRRNPQVWQTKQHLLTDLHLIPGRSALPRSPPAQPSGSISQAEPLSGAVCQGGPVSRPC